MSDDYIEALRELGPQQSGCLSDEQAKRLVQILDPPHVHPAMVAKRLLAQAQARWGTR